MNHGLVLVLKLRIAVVREDELFRIDKANLANTTQNKKDGRPSEKASTGSP